jgi:hypothetical protein
MLLVDGFWIISANTTSADGKPVEIGKSGQLPILPTWCNEPLDNFPSHGDESITNIFYSNVAEEEIAKQFPPERSEFKILQITCVPEKGQFCAKKRTWGIQISNPCNGDL